MNTCEQPTSSDMGVKGRLDHVVCECEPNVALCGTDVSDYPWGRESVNCQVCDHMEMWACPRCGT